MLYRRPDFGGATRIGADITNRSVFKLIIPMNFSGFALARSSLVCKDDWCPVISALYLVDPEEAVNLHRVYRELNFQCVCSTGKRASAVSKVASGQY